MADIFSQRHILGLIWVSVMILCLYLISNRLKSKFGIGFVLKSGAILLIAMELIKYIYLFARRELTIYYFPLNFCSLMLYIYPIIAFFPQTKIARTILPFAFSGGVLAGLITLFFPTNVLGSSDIRWLSPTSILPIISFIYHGIMVWYSSYLAYSRYYVPRYRDTFNALAFLLFFATIAGIVNMIFDQDFMLLRYGIGNPLSFLLAYNYIYYILVQVGLFLILNPLLIFIVKTLQKSKNKKNA